MSNSTNKSDGVSRWKIRRLQGRPLTSRSKWLAIKVGYVLACIAGVIAVVLFTHGIVLAIGLTVMAFFVGGFLELFALRYGDYLDEWNQANPAEPRSR
jgi:fatty acid desaturase